MIQMLSIKLDETTIQTAMRLESEKDSVGAPLVGSHLSEEQVNVISGGRGQLYNMVG
jgi:hypothetical protein